MSPDRLLSEGLGERVNLTVLSASDLPRYDELAFFGVDYCNTVFNILCCVYYQKRERS